MEVGQPRDRRAAARGHQQRRSGLPFQGEEPGKYSSRVERFRMARHSETSRVIGVNSRSNMDARADFVLGAARISRPRNHPPGRTTASGRRLPDAPIAPVYSGACAPCAPGQLPSRGGGARLRGLTRPASPLRHSDHARNHHRRIGRAADPPRCGNRERADCGRRFLRTSPLPK